jgi:Tfp pilus assembly protein PilF
MLGADPTGAPEATLAALTAATRDWRDGLASRVDFPETPLQSGGAALTGRNLQLADAAFSEAVALDPQLVDAWSMIVQIRAAAGDGAGAWQALDQALAINPGTPALEALRGQLGP